MTTISVFVIWEEAKETIEKIGHDFPCFANTTPLEDGWVEFCIKCREEDAKAIENRLARWV